MCVCVGGRGGGGAVPISGSPKRPGWVFPEGLPVGSGVPLSSWIWDHFSRS